MIAQKAIPFLQEVVKLVTFTPSYAEVISWAQLSKSELALLAVMTTTDFYMYKPLC